MIEAQAAQKRGAKLTPFSYEPKPLGPHDVAIEISHCGVCHSDVHLIDNDWMISRYPLVPGHEIVGTVTEVGDLVPNSRVGTRVGVGWQRSACLTCETCIAGHENLCGRTRATCVANHGGFAKAIHVDGRFAFEIPDGLDSARAAPLLCGGVTVFAPMRRFDIKAGKRVGVIGIGGLGHMAVKLARALGAEVTAFSRSADKAEEAMKMGAHHYFTADQVKKAAGSLDLLISTVFTQLDWAAYLDTLRVNGTLCFVGVPGMQVELPTAPIVFKQCCVTGGAIGGRADIQDMLRVAALHDIGADVEIVPLAEAQSAIEKARKSEARYRMVLEM